MKNVRKEPEIVGENIKYIAKDEKYWNSQS